MIGIAIQMGQCPSGSVKVSGLAFAYRKRLRLIGFCALPG